MIATKTRQLVFGGRISFSMKRGLFWQDRVFRTGPPSFFYRTAGVTRIQKIIFRFVEAALKIYIEHVSLNIHDRNTGVARIE